MKNLRKSLGLVDKTDLTKPGRESWMPDEAITECMHCNAAFGMITVRKHHCRACGGVFCDSCSSKEIAFTATSRKDEESYKEKKKRVCDSCFSKIDEAQKRELSASARAEAAAQEMLGLKDRLDSFTGDELTAEQKELHAQLIKHEEEADALDAERAESARQRLDAEGAEEELEPEPVSESGAYLVYSPTSSGVMYLYWSHEKVEGALAYGRPRIEVPAFKFARGGRWELQRNINGDKSSYYLAASMFVKNCAKFKCSITDLTDSVPAPMPLSLVLHHAEGIRLLRVLPAQTYDLEGVDAVAAIHTDVTALDLGTMPLQRFLALGKEHGAAVVLELPTTSCSAAPTGAGGYSATEALPAAPGAASS